MRRKAGHRRVLVKVDQDIGRELVELALARRIIVQRLAQPRIAEIAEQQQAAVEVAGQDVGALRPRPTSHSATAMNGRGSSCGGGASISTAERSPSTTRK